MMEIGMGGMFCATVAVVCCGGGFADVDVDFGGDALAVDPWTVVDELMSVSSSKEFCMCVSGGISCVGDDGGDKRPALECCDCCDGDGGGDFGWIGLLLLLRDGDTDTFVEGIVRVCCGNENVYGINGRTITVNLFWADRNLNKEKK